MANRNQRATRNSAINKPFVSGGVISNFTNATTPVAASKPVANLAATIVPTNVSFYQNSRSLRPNLYIFCIQFNEYSHYQMQFIPFIKKKTLKHGNTKSLV